MCEWLPLQDVYLNVAHIEAITRVAAIEEPGFLCVIRTATGQTHRATGALALAVWNWRCNAIQPFLVEQKQKYVQAPTERIIRE